MGFWKLILSKVIGRIPPVAVMDEYTLAWNVREGKLFGLKVSAEGVKEVVQVGVSGSGLPLGGTAGQVATKASENDGDVIWADPQGGDVSLQLDAETITFSGVTINLIAGENLVKGDACRIASTGKALKADASVIATSYCFVMATDAILQDATGEFLLIGIIGGFTGLTIGAPLFLSITTGTLSQSAPTGTLEIVQIIGIAISATHIYFKPETTQGELL